MGNGNSRVTYKDIMAHQEKVFDELTDIRKEVSKVREGQAKEAEKTKHLLRRDTIGYIWDSFTTLIAAIAIALTTRQH